MYLLLGAGSNWPINVDYVHVWQAPVVVTPPAVAQTFTFSDIPEVATLPANSNQGLPVSYSVTSGPAAVSGDTLTISGSGTITLGVSQAGNAKYLPFSSTETIVAQ